MANLKTNNLCGDGGRNAYSGSVFFDGYANYLKIPSSNDFAYGTGDFNWEAWVLLARGQATGYIFDHGSDGGTLQYESNNVRYYNSTTGNSGALYDDGGSIDYDGWHHIAVSRSSGTTKLFVNGIQKASASDSHNYSAQALTIGDYGAHTGSNKWKGYISNARICKGHAIYTGNFTPPTSPLTVHYNSDGDETVLLCCQDSDDPTKEATGKTITAFGGNYQTGNNSILVNSDFSSGTTGFTGDSGAGISESGGVMTVTNGGNDNLYALKQNSCLRIGGRYRCTATITPTFASGNPVFRVRFGGDAESFVQPQSTMSNGVTFRLDTGEKVADGRDFEIGSGNSSGITQFTITDLVVTAIDPPIAPEVIPPYGVDAGNTFNGAITMNSFSYMYFQTGRTEERGRGRAIWGGGQNGSSNELSTMDYLDIQSSGIAIDFGDLSDSRNEVRGCGSSTRGVFAGGRSPHPSVTDRIDYVEIVTTSNATDFGNLTVARAAVAAVSNSTRGCFMAGFGPSNRNEIDYITIASVGNAIDFGDMLGTYQAQGRAMSPTRGLASGNYGASNLIEYITIPTTGNSTDFGDRTVAAYSATGTSDNTRGVFIGGDGTPSTTNVIDFVTIASTGDATDFGDLITANGSSHAATSNSVVGCSGGGQSNTNTIEKITIQTTGNAVDYGDLTLGRAQIGATSDSHGGLS